MDGFTMNDARFNYHTSDFRRRRICVRLWSKNEPLLLLVLALMGCGVCNTEAAERHPITVVALGDSTTAPRRVGASESGRSKKPTSQGETEVDPTTLPHNVVNGADQQSPWLYVYADILRDELPRRGIVVNAVDNEGKGGTRTDDALARLRSDVQAKSPDWVIVQFGINDSWWDSGRPPNVTQPDSSRSRLAIDAGAQTGYDGVLANGNDHPHADRGNFVDNLTRIVRTLQTSKVRVILMTPNQLSVDEDELWRNVLLARYAEAVRKISISENVLCVDVWELYDKFASNQRRPIKALLIDSEHPNAVAHRMIADALADEIAGKNQK